MFNNILDISIEIIKPRKQYTFDNYFSDVDLKGEFISLIESKENKLIIISGKKGSGVTHLINAIANEYSFRKKACYVTAEWIVAILKKSNLNGNHKEFLDFLFEFDLICIDNIQFFYRKSSAYINFLFELIELMQTQNKTIIFGCSDPQKDITVGSKFKKLSGLRRFGILPSGSLSAFKMLKSLCTPEDLIPDKFLFLISGYNGSVQQYINCLISVRFKSKMLAVDLYKLNEEELESQFDLRSYFPGQQLRKSFLQSSLHFIDSYKNLLKS